jgi:hypothetical protein
MYRIKKNHSFYNTRFWTLLIIIENTNSIIIIIIIIMNINRKRDIKGTEWRRWHELSLKMCPSNSILICYMKYIL